MDFLEMAKSGNLVPNQRVIKVSKSPTDKDNYYCCINLEAIEEAMFNLKSHYGFKLYIYIAKNMNEHCFRFSRSHFMEYANCSRQGYTTAFNELIDKGYLTLKGTIGAYNNEMYLFTDKSVKKDNPYASHIVEIDYDLKDMLDW